MLIAPIWLKIQTSLGDWDSSDMTLKFFRKVGVPKVTFPLYFWALNANCSTAIKVTDFKFDINVPRDTLDVTPLKFSEKRACMARDA